MNEPDHERFLEVWTRCQPMVATYLASLVGMRQVDDLIQEVALTCWRRFADYDPERPFLHWALGVARNHALKSWAERARIPLPLGDQVAESLAAAAEDDLTEIPQRNEALRHCLDGLPEASQQVVHLVYGEGQDQERVAETLGLSHGTLRTRLSRLREVLRGCIERRLRMEADDA